MKNRYLIYFIIVGLFLGSIISPFIHNIVDAEYGKVTDYNITVDKQVVKDFLKDNFKWRLMASPNLVNWYYADSLMNINLNWIDKENSYKVTLTLDTTSAPQSLYYRFDLAMNKTILDYAEINGFHWKFIVSEYVMYFDWSDLKPLLDVNNTKITVSKGIKNNFFWFRVQTINKINVGVVFIVDPLYGVVTQSTISSYEWDFEEGRVHGYNNMVRLNNTNYYVTVSMGDSGSDLDGIMRVLYVWSNNGTIKQSTIDFWEYDISEGYYANIQYLTSDIYVVYYSDNSASKTRFFTVRIWANNGTISKTMLDIQDLTNPGAFNYDYSMKFTVNIWCFLYTDSANDGWLETWWISNIGIINNTVLDTQEFDTAYCNNAVACLVDSNTIAITYEGVSYPNGDYLIRTYNITGAGIITNTYADTYTYESSSLQFSCIDKVGTNIYAVTWVDGGNDVNCGTVTIANTGMITKSLIDTLEIFGGTTVACLITFIIHDPSLANDGKGILGCTIQGDGLDGWLYTWNITKLGIMDSAIISSYEFDTSQSTYLAPVLYCNQSWYFLLMTDVDLDGQAKTLYISTNWATPIISSVIPINYANGISLRPQLCFTVNDKNGGTVNIMWEVYVGASYIVRQNNMSVACNGTYYFTCTDATLYNTLYSWRYSVADGFHNESAVYVFTTRNERSPTITIPHPINSSVDNTLLERCNITINDLDGDSMKLYWYENSTGSYVFRNLNSSCVNGTYRFRFSQFSVNAQRYYWKCFVNDTIRNVSAWFYFNTASGNIVIFHQNITWSIYLYCTPVVFSYTISCNNSQSVSGVNVGNGTYSINLTDLIYNCTYTIWVNQSANGGLNVSNHRYVYNMALGSGINAYTKTESDNLFVSSMITVNDFQFCLLIMLGLWIFLISKVNDDSLFGVLQIFIALPLSVFIGGYSYLNSLAYGYMVGICILVVSLLVLFFAYWKKPNKQ